MKTLSRRQFLQCSAATLACAAWPWPAWPAGLGGLEDIRGRVFKGGAPKSLWKWSKEGFMYTKLADQKVVCRICPNRCVMAPGDRSACRSKINLQGTLYSLAYGNPCAVNNDPVEKKPLFHFLPRSMVFSLATTGCNFRCLNCQNWEISQAQPEQVRHIELFPADAVHQAGQAQAASIAYTYSEAITYFEYMYDIAQLARPQGLNNLLISNGYINTKPLLALCQVLDAANINLKSYDDAVYRKLNGGRLDPVLRTLKTLHDQGVHFEITTLVVPGYVDDEEMIKKMCGWILDHLGPNHPLHFLRFFPRYKLDRLPPTPISTLTRLRELAMQQGLRYVYVGNVPAHEGNNTFCHACGKLLVERQGYYIPTFNIVDSRCRFCEEVIPGRWHT